MLLPFAARSLTEGAAVSRVTSTHSSLVYLLSAPWAAGAAPGAATLAEGVVPTDAGADAGANSPLFGTAAAVAASSSSRHSTAPGAPFAPFLPAHHRPYATSTASTGGSASASAAGASPSQPQAAATAAADSKVGDELFVGGYTPITKKLWTERRRQAQAAGTPSPSAAAVAPVAAPPPVGGQRPPKPVHVVYNFATDRTLLDMYRNPWGHMRLGRLLEDLDSLAGNVAFEHCYTGSRGLPLLVTAAVDEIAVAHPLLLERDVIVRGAVVWTGRSSLDIRMQLFQAHHEPTPSLEALFSFVHLDPTTRKASPVVQLAPEAAEDVAAFAERQAVADARKAARQGQGGAGELHAVPPQTRDWVRAARRMQELPALAPSDGVLMPATSQHNTFICQPQNRNTHGRVFGGFLMRRAYELGFATTYMFGGCRPVFHKVDEITFSRPVDVGDLLRLTSTVVHAAPLDPEKRRARVVVEVEARVTKPEVVESFVTNTFTFVFDLVAPPGGPPLSVKRVLPTCDEEALRCWRAQQL